ncbi:MAG: zinc-binding dehydrogenase [Planctomycetes bacterium]|nr:zinc-binding dehydrogenase [Planctomycetota bacterium]
METEAAVLEELGAPLRLRRLAIPALKPGQVLVEVAYSGVCHTQVLEARGKRGPDRFLPHLLGHEGSGVVLETGPGASKVRPGDRVVLSWIKGSGLDVPGTIYEGDRGRVNAGALCTFARRTVTCESRVTPIPASMPLREAALLGCAVPTGGGIVLNTLGLRPGPSGGAAGKSLAVFGAGGIGLSAVLAAAMVGLDVVIAVDVAPHKLEQARAAGATHAVDARERDPVAAVLEITGGRGADFAIEAAGRRATMEGAFAAVRPAGGLCVLAGNLPHGERISVDPMDLIRGKRIAGTWGGESMPDRDIPIYADLYLSGKLNLAVLLTHAYGLGEINRALDDLEAGKVGRALIDMSKESG